MRIRLFLLAALAVALGQGSDCAPVNGTSATGSTTTAACNNPPPPANSLCTECLSTNCADQTAAAYGPEWRSGSYSGGVCEAVLTCECACTTNDTTCVAACDAKDGLDCETAKARVSACSQSNACGCVF